MRPLRLGMHVGTAALLVGVSSACSVLGGDDADPPSGVADDLAAALSAHSLADVPLVDDADRAAFADLVAPLEEVPVAVEVTSVDEVEGTGDEPGSATATLAWRWQLTDSAPWEYDTTVALVPAGTGWQVDWAPDALAPDLADGDTLGLRTVPPVRGDITGADGAVLVTERPVLRYGLDKTKVAGAAGRPQRPTDRAGPRRRRGVVRRARRGEGAEAFVEALVLREDDAPRRAARLREDPRRARRARHHAAGPDARVRAALLGRVGPATAEVVEASDGRIVAGDEVGLSGLQARYDEQLRGMPGAAVVARDADDQLRTLAEVPATDGAASSPPSTPRSSRRPRTCSPPSARVRPAAALVAIRPSTGAVLASANGSGAAGADTRLTGSTPPARRSRSSRRSRCCAPGWRADDAVSLPRDDGRGRQVVQELRRLPGRRAGRHHPDASAVANSCNTAFIGQRDRLADGELAAAAAALGLGVDHDLGFPAYFGQVPPPEHGDRGAAADMIGQGTVLASPMAMADGGRVGPGRSGRAARRCSPDHQVEQAAPDRAAHRRGGRHRSAL